MCVCLCVCVCVFVCVYVCVCVCVCVCVEHHDSRARCGIESALHDAGAEEDVDGDGLFARVV